MNRNLLTSLLVTGGVVALVIVVATVRESRESPEPQKTRGAALESPRVSSARALPRMVDLGADKCIPCKKMAPILAELKTEYAGKATVEFIDVWKNPKAGEPYDIRIIQTQIFFDREGKEVWRHEGFLPKDEIITKLKELGAV
ncbi:MAG: hypothetical protein HBSAPP02_10230 [Phycisphaerae bacterium]|nr:MAG: thioredoxin family protein [Planctomycetia bacterium]RIK66982.1 MAG: thioredoxin [Planctomycetota bacterium]GJQ25991.1 MAG: hypothetical protein HBSAPP02_10230 [Phycisphaerae bacterium]